MGQRLGRPSVSLATRRRERRRRRSRLDRRAEIIGTLARYGAGVSLAGRRMGRRPQAAAQGRDASPHGEVLHRLHGSDHTFCDDEAAGGAHENNRAGLSVTMDKLKLKYGHTTLHCAGMLPARESAPTRIAFTQIPVQYGVDYM